MKKQNSLFIVLSLFFLILSTNGLSATETDYFERILNFHSDIEIDTTGRVLVTEKIRINVTGESINRGIVRTIPIFRKDNKGYKQRVDINILSVERDGVVENFFTKQEEDDFAIYIGNEYGSLTPDVYEYRIVYESYGHIGFFDDYDEIYWNVTGNDWAFKIDSVSATVHVPKGSKILTNSCYTGKYGSTDSNCEYSLQGDSIVKFYGTQKLYTKEGFTVATSFTPFIIKRPSQYQLFWQKYNYLIILGGSILILLSYFGFLFNKYPNNKPTIIPTFNPPLGKSAGDIRYLAERIIDSKTLTATILSLAIKGVISIKSQEKNYLILKKNEPQNLNEEEKVLYEKIFEGGASSINLTKDYSPIWQSAYNSTISKIKSKNNLIEYYPSRIRYFLKGLILTFFLIASSVFYLLYTHNIDSHQVIFLSILAGFTIFLSSVIYLSYESIICLIISLFILFLQFIIMSDDIITKYLIIAIYVFILINLLFWKFFKVYSKKGLELSTYLKGFKMYLKIAEKDRLNFLTPPDNTPEQFEKMLPYAVALDLEIEWAEKFAKTLKEYKYKPLWYENINLISYTDFTISLTSFLERTTSKPIIIKESSNFNSSINSNRNSSSSSRSSGSSSNSSGSSNWSSGSRGGGSSGGGGGGGGGRGW